MREVDDYVESATLEEKAKAFDYLLEYHKHTKDTIQPIHHDQVCRMTTYLRAVMEKHWMLDGDDLVMYYDIWSDE